MSEDTYTVQLHWRISGTTNVVRSVGDPVVRTRVADAYAWVDWMLSNSEYIVAMSCDPAIGQAVVELGDVKSNIEFVVAMSCVSTNSTAWFGLGSVIVKGKDEMVIGPGTVQIPPCYVYDGPEDLTMADLPPDVVIKRVLIKKEHFEAHLDGGDHILVERREADLLHKAYMIGKEIERERAEDETYMAAMAAKE